jgi:hypothetical protein
MNDMSQGVLRVAEIEKKREPGAWRDNWVILPGEHKYMALILQVVCWTRGVGPCSIKIVAKSKNVKTGCDLARYLVWHCGSK